MGYLNDIDNLQKEMKNYTRRMDAGKLSVNDSKTMLQMTESYDDFFKEYQKLNQISEDDLPVYEGLMSDLLKFQKGIRQQDKEAVTDAYKGFSKGTETMWANQKKREVMMDVFRIDSEEMKLHQAKLNTLQKLVTMELDTQGGLSKLMLEILDVQHCEVVDGQVQDKADWMPIIRKAEKKEPSWIEILSESPKKSQTISSSIPAEAPKENLSAEPPKENHVPNQNKDKRAYQGTAYMKGTGETQKPVIVYGTSPENIMNTFRSWNGERTEDRKFQNCYIRKYNPEDRKYENPAKYDIATGADITPIYLKLPNMDRPQFLNTVEELKRNGAKYNPHQKAFYITRQQDASKFAAYIPVSEKLSVMGKLSQNKAQANASAPLKKQMQRQDKEAVC
ncbi:hypothetical protein IMSAG249_00273 [Lachnospiraceae bacterium]|nr:hypothetical protein IMSAGC009_00638 [Lachnospiraceae bacterium]GFI68456.1 hypothetical protein IMSAG249_00273 [Lachnospiraceae bacterium]